MTRSERISTGLVVVMVVAPWALARSSRRMIPAAMIIRYHEAAVWRSVASYCGRRAIAAEAAYGRMLR